ncbi:Leucyl-tRNA synthetase [Alteracholeplasma palmae J233]|uniref:Leucine--tRNA ligase n=1 Tax=Alteracholeplasma palmae (strain ATCC 49389 / J233) TaxID=1318466 RepID=U4KK29_ALTPJ|nr:leucine--tRNA ligase [Alteracholeplasma palmae]CCV63974.1 Leucyl-tRNA synthetase [Alteracholeplasma palmae J233]
MKNYEYKTIEKKWQKHWLENKLFKTQEDRFRPTFYCLDMFPYPSASGLHVGHIEGYSASDIMSRFKRMQGYNVLHPFGWDAFGLPAEQFALATGKDPRSFTYENIKNFKRQIIEAGKGVDWDRELATADPNYFQWTQWIFKKLYENNLAVLKDVEVNFCEALGTVLANDEIVTVDGKMFSERGNYPVVKKAMRQWVLKITEYADRLLEDLELVDWPENLKEMQRNWIGKSTGAMITFKTTVDDYAFDIFTTRPDTIYGATYCVLAPEHPLALALASDDEKDQVLEYIEKTKQKQELDRLAYKEKTGVFTGSYAINPANQKRIPIWLADYVLPNYGTGAVMAVPAHDDRDFEFAQKYGLDIIEVIKNAEDKAFTGDGIHFNSGILDGLNNEDAKNKIIADLEKRQIGYSHSNYKLRDWVFSRQRYWGEPFPVIYDENGNIHLLEDNELPLELPVLDNIRPSGTGESPLANATEWLYVSNKGKRDTNTMPQLAGSSWYYIGYILKNHLGMIPLNSPEAKSLLDQFLPVDLYIGGTEHAVGHLLYARFWHKFLYDLGLVSTKEPFKKLVNQGMILGSDHSKMSKSRNNGVSPDEVISTHGADALRLYEMFMGPLEAEKPWSTDGLDGAKRFLDRVWRMFDFEITEENQESLETVYHQTIKKVTEDYEKLGFNTAISQMMIFVNEVYKLKKIGKKQARGFLQLLNPIAPHMTEELNQDVLNYHEELIYSEWPLFDEKYLVVSHVELVVQVNGKLRAKIEIEVDTKQEVIEALALKEENVMKFTEGLTIRKIIYVPNKLLNIVVA